MKIRWVLGGVIGGLVGAAIWAFISYKSDYEIGWIAWGVGALTGLGVRIAAKDDVGYGPGIVAVVLAILALVGGKFAAVHFAVHDAFAEMSMEGPTDQDLLIGLADEVVGEYEDRGKSLAWPEGMTVEEADEEKDYPPDVWAEARRRFEAESPQQRQATRDEMVRNQREFLGAFEGEVRKQAFRESFGPYDILWFILAVLSAFKIGSGATNE